MTVHLGIDPGAVSGAWGLIDHHGEFQSCGDIPNKDGRINTRQFWAALSQAIDKRDCVIWCESVFSRPGQGIASSFKFGRAAGAIEAVCERFMYPWHLITPNSWKKHFLLNSNKDESSALARSLFPKAVPQLRRKKDHGRAEALLIARYGLSQWEDV